MNKSSEDLSEMDWQVRCIHNAFLNFGGFFLWISGMNGVY